MMCAMRRQGLFLGVCLAMLLGAAPALAAPEPKFGKTAQVSAISGTVKVKEKGESKFAKLGKKPKLIPLESVVDAKRGKVRVRAAGKGRGLEQGVFYKGDFEIRQDKQEGLTDLVLQGEIGGGGCPVVKYGNARGGGAIPRLSGETKDAFRTLGWFGDAEVTQEDETKWTTEDLCDGTRTVVKTGEVTASAGSVLIQDVDAGATIKHFCDYDGVAPVSTVFCTVLTHAPDLGVWGGGLVNQGEATTYDLCVTNPAGEEKCTNYPFSEPYGPGYRDSVITCIADSGPGNYSLRWLIDGVQLGPSQAFTINTPPGQNCIQRP
jgi:hypothetical protein